MAWDPNALGGGNQQQLDAGLLKLSFGWNSEVFESKLGNLANVVIPHMGVAMEEIAKAAFNVVVNRTPKAKHSHTDVRALWQMQYTREETVQEFIISNLYPKQEVLWFMEEGTRPHVIKPKGPWLLHWENEDTGEEIYAKQVRHPGTRPYHMIREARNIAEPLIREYIDKTFAQVRDMGSY
jgi:hypothetical protein